MGYYQGDYYRGDYYQGSPLALIGGALKLGSKLLKPAAKLGKKAVAAGKALLSKPGVKKAVTVGTGVGITVPTVVSIGSKKSVDEAKAMAAGGEMLMPRRSRRMNVTNPKALRRAIRRARGFAKLARKVLTFPISKPPKGRALFKKARR